MGLVPHMTPAEVEGFIDKAVTQYKRGLLTWGEYMLLLQDSVTAGMRHAEAGDRVDLPGRSLTVPPGVTD